MPHAQTARSTVTEAAAFSIEPGLLGVYRIFLVLVVGLLALRLPAAANAGAAMHPSPWPGAVGVSLLFAGLCSSRLQRWLGRAYLPLAIVLFVVPALLSGVAAMKLRMAAGFAPDEVARNAWVLLVLLIVPLILVAWQYGFRWALAYCAVTAAADIGLAWPLVDEGGASLPALVDIAMVRSIVLLPVGYAVARLMEVQRRQRAELAEAHARLARYATTLESVAAERERSRLAQELHDTLAHGLSSLAVQLEAMQALWSSQPRRVHAMLGEALTATRTALADSRRAIKALRARPLEDVGLLAALRHLAEATAERHGLALTLELPATLEGLDVQAEHAVYRIASEAMTNVVRHARAQRLSVRLGGDARQLRLTIADDGVGFHAAGYGHVGADDASPFGPNDGSHFGTDDRSHFGLYGMHERARLIGAELAVESAPGAGTSLQLTVGRPA